MKNLLLLCLCVALLSGCGGSKSESVLLRLKYKAGDEQEISILTKAESSGSYKMGAMTETIFKLRIDSVLSNGYSCSVSIKNMKFSETLDGKITQSYDSDKPRHQMNEEELEMDHVSRHSLESSYYLLLSQRGEPLKPLRYSNGNTLPSSETPFDIQVAQVVFPEKPVKVGDTWSNKSKVEILGVDRTYIYKVAKITEDEVYLDVIINIEGMTKGNKTAGQYVISRATGKLLKASTTVDMINTIVQNQITVK